MRRRLTPELIPLTENAQNTARMRWVLLLLASQSVTSTTDSCASLTLRKHMETWLLGALQYHPWIHLTHYEFVSLQYTILVCVLFQPLTLLFHVDFSDSWDAKIQYVDVGIPHGSRSSSLLFRAAVSTPVFSGDAGCAVPDANDATGLLQHPTLGPKLVSTAEDPWRFSMIFFWKSSQGSRPKTHGSIVSEWHL